MVLVEYLAFLKNNYPDALALESAKLFKAKDIPLFRFFTHVNDADFLEGAKRGILKFIDDFEHGREYDALEEGIKKWVNNENTGFTKEQVQIDDLINIYSAQKEAILHFVHLFTAEASLCVQIFKELEAYFNRANHLAITTFIQIHSEELKGSERKYRLLAENSSDVISKQTIEGIYTYVSPSCKMVLGYEPEEMLGKNVCDFIHIENQDASGRMIGSQTEKGIPETFTIRMKRKDGMYVWLEVKARRITDIQTEEIKEIHTSARNITPRKLAEERLKQNELLLLESQRLARIGSWEWDIKSNELSWTKEHYALYNIDPAEKITYEMAELMRHPDDTEHVHNSIRETLKHNAPLDFVHRLIIDGDIKVLQVKGEPIVVNGETVKLRGTSQDITQISHFQEQMAKKNHQLQEAQQTAHLGSWECDMQNDVMFWSDEMYRVFGYEPGSKAINFNFYINRIFPGDGERVKDHFNKCRTEGLSYSFENRIVTHHGHIRWLYSTGQVSERKGEKILALSGTVFDITDRKKAEIALNEKIKDLERSNNDLQLYASIASHDLKEPLRKIKANSSVLVENYSDSIDPKIRKYLDRIDGSASRMEKLIEDVLSVSKITGKKGNLRKTDLNNIVNQCLCDLEIPIKTKNVKVCVDKLPDGLVVNPDQIYQLFQNIIANALKFTKQSETPTIHITSHFGGPSHEVNIDAGVDEYCNIVFRDNGIGFEQVFADKIFVMFQRLHEREKYEGNGIGLAICKKIVENHDGFISAQGEIGKGAAFTVSIPVKNQEIFLTQELNA